MKPQTIQMDHADYRSEVMGIANANVMVRINHAATPAQMRQMAEDLLALAEQKAAGLPAITHARESLTRQNAAEIDAMVAGYYASTPAHVGIPPYDFCWEVYETLESRGALILTTARRPGALVGFALYTITEHPHHRGLVVADCDSLVVAPQARGGGVGAALYRFTEPLLIEAGARKILNRHRLCYGAAPLFPRLGFTAAETLFVKEIET